MKTIVFKSLTALAIIALLFLSIYMVRYSIKDAINNIFPPTEISSLNLSQEEKIEDFEYFYDTVVSSMTSIDNYEYLYGFNFKKRRGLYIKLILETKNDYEFYALMDAIVQEIPSFHTELLDPYSYNKVNCYNCEAVRTDRDVIRHNKYWRNIVDIVKSEDDSKYYSFLYNRGYYYFNTAESSVDSKISNYKLEKINGISVDEYVTKLPSVFNLYYDGENNKLCRTRIVFNDRKGKECKLTLSSDNGDTISYTLFSNIYLERVFLDKVNDMYDEKDENSDFIAFEAPNISYVKIDDFDLKNGSKVENLFKNIKNNNVILDLRQNSGGNNKFAADIIYPYLFSKKIIEENIFYVPKSNANECITRNIFNVLNIHLKNSESNPFNKNIEMYQGKKINSYIGKIKKNKNVAILASHYTGSAADTFILDMKKNNLAYVIGNNTGGEGLNFSCVELKLPNSNLAFVYTPGGSYTFDNYDNSVYGTRPDFYLDTTESFIDYLYNNRPKGFDDLYNNDETIRYAYEYLINNYT